MSEKPTNPLTNEEFRRGYELLRNPSSLEIPIKENSDDLVRFFRNRYPVLTTELGDNILGAMLSQTTSGLDAARGRDMDVFLSLFQDLEKNNQHLDQEKVKSLARRYLNEELAGKIEEIIQSGGQEAHSPTQKTVLQVDQGWTQGNLDQKTGPKGPANT